MMEALETVKLNLGCGGRPIAGYTNIDQDSLDDMKVRYPHQVFNDDLKIFQYDIFDLPFEDNSVDEVRAESFIEHLCFMDEKKLFLEVKRILKKDGVFRWSVPDFEDAVKIWLAAKDDWKEFYRDDDEAIKSEHWFGNYSYSTENRWGYLTAMIFGSQNGEGQYHQNAYTEGKVNAMMKYLGFEVTELSKFKWKGKRDLMLKIEARKLS